MNDEAKSIQERYFALLHDYIARPDEKYLAVAAELGHEVMRSGFPIERIAEVHHEATIQLARNNPNRLLKDVAQTITEPLLELLMAFSLEFRKRAEEKNRMETALQHAVLEWRRTVDTVNDIILLLDAEGRVLRTNKATRAFSKQETGRLSLLPIETLGTGPPWEVMVELVEQVKRSRSSASRQMEDTRNGRTWDITATFSSVEAEEDRIVIVARDISEIMNMQASLRRGELLSKMGSLLGDFAHEVRNPLFSISATIDAFEARFGGRDEFREYFKMLRGELNRTNNLMKQLLEYGKPTRSEFALCGIEDVMTDAINSCAIKAADAGVRVINNVLGKPRPVQMDRVRLGQAFANILVNAIEFSPPGSAVTIDSQEIVEKEGAWMICKFQDQGPGFGNEELSLVFEPFFSRRRGGTGLGLSIVRRVVEDHGGQVWASNRTGGGGMMTVKLPRKP